MKMHMLCRNVLKSGAAAVGALAASGILANVQPVLAASGGNGAGSPAAGKAGVYFTQDLSAEGLRKIYAAVNQGITGKVAAKLHTGEPNGPNIMPREWVKALMPDLGDAAIVECNVLYPAPAKQLKVIGKPLPPMAGHSARWTSWTRTVMSLFPLKAANGFRKWPWARTSHSMIQWSYLLISRAMPWAVLAVR